MPSTHSLLNALKRDHPSIKFEPGDRFHWSPSANVITYANTYDAASLLHEVAHAALKHDTYRHDIDLLRMEREAWDYTLTSLAKQYNIDINSDIAEEMLDTYRDWLHSRSLCPNCEATGLQTDQKQYKCLACASSWRVNEAKSCALRRYKAK